VACLSIPALGFGWFNLKLKVTPRGGLIERQAKKMFYKLFEDIPSFIRRMLITRKIYRNTKTVYV